MIVNERCYHCDGRMEINQDFMTEIKCLNCGRTRELNEEDTEYVRRLTSIPPARFSGKRYRHYIRR